MTEESQSITTGCNMRRRRRRFWEKAGAKKETHIGLEKSYIILVQRWRSLLRRIIVLHRQSSWERDSASQRLFPVSGRFWVSLFVLLGFASLAETSARMDSRSQTTSSHQIPNPESLPPWSRSQTTSAENAFLDRKDYYFLCQDSPTPHPHPSPAPPK